MMNQETTDLLAEEEIQRENGSDPSACSTTTGGPPAPACTDLPAERSVSFAPGAKSGDEEEKTDPISLSGGSSLKQNRKKKNSSGVPRRPALPLRPYYYETLPEGWKNQAPVLQVWPTIKGVVNHSYRDFSALPVDLQRPDPVDLPEMNFAQKMHHMLTYRPDSFALHWMPHGRSFRVLKLVEFNQVLPDYLGHNRYATLLQQLTTYGFKHITTGPDRNTYYHQLMLRGLPHLCRYMPPPQNARRLLPDPQNEPDLERISRRFPLPEKNG